MKKSFILGICMFLIIISSASAVLYDDFEDDAINWSKWKNSTPSISGAPTSIAFESSGYMKSRLYASDNGGSSYKSIYASDNTSFPDINQHLLVINISKLNLSTPARGDGSGACLRIIGDENLTPATANYHNLFYGTTIFGQEGFGGYTGNGAICGDGTLSLIIENISILVDTTANQFNVTYNQGTKSNLSANAKFSCQSRPKHKHLCKNLQKL